VVLLATGARIGEITPQIVTACELGLNVVCIGEDAIFPAAVSAEYAALIDAAARAHAVSVVGTGINPGFVMDMLPLVLTAPMRCWKTLHVRRVSDLSGYGESVLRSLGIGLAPQEFDASVSRDGVGHVGFSGSVCFVAAGLGVEVESCTEEAIPITRNAVTVLGERSFPSGRVIGVNQRCRATTSSGQTITLEHPQTVGMLEDEAHDLIEVSGDPGVRLRISPGYDGGAATVALLLNLAAAAPSLPPGLQPMSALPLAAMLSSRTAFAEAAVEAA
jgi:4-hydroxy-tetrahydrodipicolinate reductase